LFAVRRGIRYVKLIERPLSAATTAFFRRIHVVITLDSLNGRRRFRAHRVVATHIPILAASNPYTTPTSLQCHRNIVGTTGHRYNFFWPACWDSRRQSAPCCPRQRLVKSRLKWRLAEKMRGSGGSRARRRIVLLVLIGSTRTGREAWPTTTT
jgi:hypothetical protein